MRKKDYKGVNTVVIFYAGQHLIKIKHPCSGTLRTHYNSHTNHYTKQI